MKRVRQLLLQPLIEHKTNTAFKELSETLMVDAAVLSRRISAVLGEHVSGRVVSVRAPKNGNELVTMDNSQVVNHGVNSVGSSHVAVCT